MLEVKHGYLYTGYTTNLARRYWMHLNGKGAKYTRSFPPRRIAQCWRVLGSKSMAMKVEYYIKQQDRKKKALLVEKPEKLRKMISEELELEIDLYAFDPVAVEKSALEKDWRRSSKNIDPFDSLPETDILTYHE